jgi:hypothetical protein
MTCAINANTTGLDELTNVVSDKGSSSFSGSGGIDMGAFMGTALEPCTSCLNRGYIRSGWEWTEAGQSKKGIYVNKSGVENAISGNYPSEVCSVCLGGEISGQGLMDIVIKTNTTCYGKVISQCIYTQPISGSSSSAVTNTLWQGPSATGSASSDSTATTTYSFIRRIGRITDDTTHPISSCSSTYYNKVLNTNDLVMPILPARGEKEEHEVDKHSVSLIGNFQDNSVIIKNIANGGGLKFENNSNTRVKVTSGVEFFAAESSDSTEGEGEGEAKFPEIAPHIEPGNFDITIACIPVKEQHYNWCKSTSSWVPVTSGDSTSDCGPKPEEKGSIVIKAKTLCDKPWQIGWSYEGEVEIPVKDFTPGEGVEYEAGRGINISEQQVPSSDPNSTETTTKNVICNTMTITQGCLISVTEPQPGEYKISGCKTKVEAGDGICVSEIQGGWKVTAKDPCIKITGGNGIDVTGGPKCWTITNNTTYTPTEVVAGNGICVVQTGNKYKVSVKAPCSTCCICICGVKYSFDPAWFIVTDTNVTINEAKINEVAAGIAPTVSSQITSTATAVIDTWTDETGYKGYSGNINATIVTECGTAATASVTTSRN